MRYEEIDLVDNSEDGSFELWIEGKRSFVDYQLNGSKIYLLHTEVPKEQEGMGIAAALLEKVLHTIEDRAMVIVPRCLYVQQHLKRHPEWNRLLPKD